jgi:hypothetical protein
MAPRLPRDKSRSGKECVKGSSRRTRAANEQGLPRIEHLKRLRCPSATKGVYPPDSDMGLYLCQPKTHEQRKGR